MKRVTLLFLLICFWMPVLSNTTSTPNYFFRNINSDNGLSHNEVKTIIQDSWGFMWFGTRNRLNRYDGISMKVYNCYDSIANKSNNNISALYEDGNRQMWVGTDKGIYLFDPIVETFAFFSEQTADGIQINDWVSDIKQDNDSNIWMVIPNQGLFQYKRADKKLHHYSFGNKDIPVSGTPECMCVGKSGQVWIGTNGAGVFLYDKTTDNFSQYLGETDGNSLKNKYIFTMCDYGEYLALGIHEGKLLKLNKRKNTLSDVAAPEVNYKIIRDVVCLNNNELWVGTQAGLFIVDELNQKVEHIHEELANAHSLSDNIIDEIYQDKEGGIWLGTLFQGVDYLPYLGMKFANYIPTFDDNSISSKRIRTIKEDRLGKIWIGTEDGFINTFDPITKNFRKINYKNDQDSEKTEILCMLLRENSMWVGCFKKGLDIININDYSVKHFSGEELGLDESSIYALCEDRYGNVWLGNGWGVFKSENNQVKFSRMTEFGFGYVHDILEDSEGNIWVAYMGKGVFKYNPQTRKVVNYTNSIDDHTSLSSNSVSNITETSQGDIWFTTDRGGICKYNKTENNFTSVSIKDGLPDDVAYKIVEDKNQILWFGTNKGLVKYNPKENLIRVFNQGDGLYGNHFNYNSAVASKTGKFYFGGLNGMVAFDPCQFNENQNVPPIYITKLEIFNSEPSINVKRSPLKKSIIHTSNIRLKYNESNIAFDFASLSFTAPQSNKYAYQMEGIDKEWIYTTNNRVSYAKLPPGKYVFRVKGSNNDGLWNETGASVIVKVQPPWWFSIYAYCLYVILIQAVLYYFLLSYRRRHEKQNLEKQKIFEIEKEKELYSLKVDFFTSIAHEIRTPLTLINGPLESLKEIPIENQVVQKNLQIMENNTKQLLTLINELLDFRKMDNKKFLLKLSSVDIKDLLWKTKAEFDVLAKQQNKTISFVLPDETIEAIVDKNELTKVFNNLLTNAIKYSDKKIEIELKIKDQFFSVSISNDGELIGESESHKIFDPFYQVEKDRNMPSSTGIGLSLARSIAELHRGSLHFETTSHMNTFILELPLQQEGNIVENTIDDEKVKTYFIEEAETGTQKGHLPHILIVEDNLEMLSFIADKLTGSFIVEKATNGIEALHVLEEKNIDIVLSDIMMPEMDGYELCNKIKNDIEYSHIPVVLLTAKNDLDSKIKGLSSGADAYIEKPFSFSYLHTQLTTLLSNRRREKEAFMQKPFLPIEQIGMNKADEEFMEKIIGIINENITDSEFNVEKLSEITFMSRSSLYRKIKALTDLTPTDFIRLIRLKKSAELIREGRYRIGEICYLVGINSSSYFIKLFQKQFGMTPKEFEKS